MSDIAAVQLAAIKLRNQPVKDPAKKKMMKVHTIYSCMFINER